MKPTTSPQVQVNFRMPADLKARIEVAAQSNSRSTTAEIVSTLEEAYPDPQADLELSALASWLDYVQQGGPESEFDDRLDEINKKLERHPATKNLRLAILVNDKQEPFQAQVILTTNYPDAPTEDPSPAKETRSTASGKRNIKVPKKAGDDS